ncbi:MAG TPA: hypothetical protein VH105_12895, partial [Burkholderiales bacterium]|nr:hypothetical protein [Burkholderiales bacterium]
PLGSNDFVHIAAIAGAFVIAVLGIYLFPSYAGSTRALVPKYVSLVLAAGVALSVFLGQGALEMGVAQRFAAASLLLWFFLIGWRGYRFATAQRE